VCAKWDKFNNFGFDQLINKTVAEAWTKRKDVSSTCFIALCMHARTQCFPLSLLLLFSLLFCSVRQQLTPSLSAVSVLPNLLIGAFLLCTLSFSTDLLGLTFISARYMCTTESS